MIHEGRDRSKEEAVEPVFEGFPQDGGKCLAHKGFGRSMKPHCRRVVLDVIIEILAHAVPLSDGILNLRKRAAMGW